MSPSVGLGLIVTSRIMAPRTRRSRPWIRLRRVFQVVIPVGVAFLAASPRQAGAETIESALAKAYENNPQLNAQRAIVRQTDEGVPQALSGYRPTITANATVGRQYSDIKELIPPSPPILPTGASFPHQGLTT